MSVFFVFAETPLDQSNQTQSIQEDPRWWQEDGQQSVEAFDGQRSGLRLTRDWDGSW